MTQEEVRKAIVKYGTYVKKDGRKNICKVPCQGCGIEILNTDVVDLDAVITKRGDLFVWHRDCWDKVNTSRIK